jgi:CRP-like cAMP-binding protein
MPTDVDIAFPTLGPRDLAALTARGQPRAVRAGEVLYRAGSTDVRFYVVLEGRLEIEGCLG